MSEKTPRLPQSKRRKTRAVSNMKSKKVTWPQGLLPTEIYDAIIAYLPRSDVQNMRLVNKEFDSKVCQALFRVVVVPFRPEIYGIASDTENANAHSAVMLQDRGMRVFQGFGQWIKRFAMSFEIDHAKLANPPMKSDQEAITSFWGIYRWPFKNYNRYTQLEGLEQTADETRSMATALRYITAAQELGVSIDGGLGWLPGPDVNQRVSERAQKPVVFGESRFVPEQRSRFQPRPPNFGPSTDSRQSVYTTFERMLQEAGYRGETLEPSIRLMLESEEHGGHATTDASWDSFGNQPAQQADLAYTNWRARRPRTAQNVAILGGVNLNNTSEALDEDSDDDEDDPTHGTFPSLVPASNKTSKSKDLCSLKPNDLTTAQKEMLLEMEWAQNAFMQSWVIAIVDNHTTFSAIQTLNIARLPRRHLPILSRKDFWDSLPRLQNLLLAVIPDWRDIRKDETTWVQDLRLLPSLSVCAVYQILQEHVSHRSNITSLHFEWLGGGEYAPGLFARNQHVLAAPVVSQAMHMVNRAQNHTVLRLPYVKHLTLKNCWSSPHIMTRFLWTMKNEALDIITFDSVSLTAALPLHAQPNPMTQAGIVQNVLGVHGGAAAPAGGNNGGGIGLPPAVQVAAQPATNQSHEPNWLQLPRNGSWVEIIDHLTPAKSLSDLRYDRNIGAEPETRTARQLRKLSFTSCGYVRLPMDFDQTALEGAGVQNNMQHGTVTKRINDIDAYMMKALDHYLGVINNHLPAVEIAALENAWSFTVGWNASRPDLAADAALDGVFHAGAGRFDGFLRARSTN